jgi:hypothetical protein
MKKRWLILAGGLVFLYTLIMHAPVAVLVGHLRPETSRIDLIGPSGTLKSGTAAAVALDGRPIARNLSWTLRALPLLIARASFDVAASGDGLIIEGRASATPLGRIGLHDLRASGAIKPLAAALGLFAPLDGQLGLDAQAISISAGIPTEATGTITVNRLLWTLGRDPMPVGDFQAQIQTVDGKITATVTTLDGPLDVSGEGELDAQGRYQFHLQMRPKADAPPPLANMIRTLGAPDTQGYNHVRYSGTLPTAAVEPAAAEAAE